MSDAPTRPERLKETHGNPDAPEDFGRGRECEWCQKRVMRYTKRQVGNGPLLCSGCVETFDPIAYRKGIRRASSEPAKTALPPARGIELKNLKRVRESLGKTQDWLDAAIDAYPGYVGKAEREVLFPRLERAKKLAKALGVSLADLKGEVSGMDPEELRKAS